MDMAVAVDRFDGYCDALRAAGIRPTKSLVEAGDFTDHGGQRAMAELLRRNPLLDAVFVASDPMALGALRALEQAGRRVPDDVAVVGFDDMPMAAYTHPPLTTVRQPLDQMAAAMAELLMAQLTDALRLRRARPHHLLDRAGPARLRLTTTATIRQARRR